MYVRYLPIKNYAVTAFMHTFRTSRTMGTRPVDPKPGDVQITNLNYPNISHKPNIILHRLIEAFWQLSKNAYPSKLTLPSENFRLRQNFILVHFLQNFISF